MINNLTLNVKVVSITFLSLLFYSINIYAQCNNSSVWGGTGAPTDGTPASISSCNYAGEQAIVTNIQLGNDYVITSSNCLDYISVYDESGSLVGFGKTPLTFNATVSGVYNIHFNADENCAIEGACRATDIHCLSCGAVAGCTDPVATNYDIAATYNDCSCILPNLPNDDCSGAISLDAWLNSDGNCVMTNTSTYSGATPTTGEVVPSIDCTDGDLNPRDVWYSLTVPSSGIVAFKFMNTPGFSSIVECYTGNCGALLPYNPVLCNNEEERIYTGLTPGSTIFFRVWDYGSNDLGNHEICIRGEIPGCTDPQALNYNSSATFDDGSCNFPSASKPCTANILTVNGPCVVGDNSSLGMEPGEPAPSCFGNDNNSVWYKFIAQSNYTTVSTDFTGYTHTDTEVSLYSVGSCFNYNTFEEMACDQDGGVDAAYNSIISNVPTSIGQVYYVQVSGWNGAQGTFCLQITSPPANDQMCGAQALNCGDVKTGNTGMFSLDESDMPLEGCGVTLSSANAFYLLNGTGNDISLSLCNSSFDTRINVYCLYSGSCDNNPEFVCVGNNDDSPSCPNGSNAEISFSTVSGNQYYVMVHGFDATSGNFELTTTCSTPVSPPANQDCEDNGLACRLMGTAETIQVSDVCELITGTNVAASSIIKNPVCVSSSFQTYSSVWYTFNTGAFSAYNVELEDLTGIDVRHALYENCGGDPMFCDEETIYGLDLNTDYYLEVFTSRTNEGSFNLCLKTLETCAFLTEPNGDEVPVNNMLQWSSTPFADGYKLMIGTSSGNDDVMTLTDVGNSLTYQPSVFDYNTTYYVTLIPYDDDGDINTCPGFNFTTACPLINSTLVSLLENNCLGVNDGGIDITVSGGVGPYDYQWTGPNAYTNATEDIVQVAPGEYTLVISDTDNGCQSEMDFTIPEAAPMTAQVNSIDQACANDGSAEVIVSGGEVPYTYFWSNGATSAQISNMPAGSYSVEVTDATGCSTVFDNIEIANSGGVQSTVVNINGVGCGSANGSITLSPENGESPYSYSWISLNGITSGNVTDIAGAYAIEALPLGTYNITVTDANNCNGLVNLITVPTIGDLEPEIALLQNVNCHNNENGYIAIMADFGSAPFQFNWSTGQSEISQNGSAELNNLTGGTYGVTVTDANGCVGSRSDLVIFEPNSLNLSITGVDTPLCFGDNTGGVKTFVEGGVPPYNYLWSDGSTTADLINVGIGEYILTVTDNNGCEVISVPANISSATEIEVNLTGMTHLSCFDDNDGSIYLNLFGGNPPYTLQWNNGANNANLNNLAGGDYQCTITDSEGCSVVSETYTINAPNAAIELDFTTIEMVSCADMNDGAIDVSVVGGTAPYTFSWSNGQNSEDLVNLIPGNYLLSITDVNDCIFISDVMYVAEPDALTGVTTTTPEINGLQDGSATIVMSGGTSPYSYQWDVAAASQTEAVANNLISGIYSVTVTDANGCLFVTPVEVESMTTTAVEESNLSINRLELYPNPTSRDAQLLIEMTEYGDVDIQVYDMHGKEIGAQHYEAQKVLTVIDLEGEADGVYLVKVKAGSLTRTLLLVKQK